MQKFIIGRTPNCDISLNDLSVSKIHAEMIVDNNKVTVRDLGSTNGTFINGMKLFGIQALNQYDILKVGNSLLPWKNYVGNINDNQTVSNNQSNSNVNEQVSINNQIPDVQDWMLKLFLMGIPLVGFIMLLIWANQDEDRVTKNFAKASLWWSLILLGVSIFILVFVVSIFHR